MHKCPNDTICDNETGPDLRASKRLLSQAHSREAARGNATRSAAAHAERDRLREEQAERQRAEVERRRAEWEAEQEARAAEAAAIGEAAQGEPGYRAA